MVALIGNLLDQLGEVACETTVPDVCRQRIGVANEQSVVRAAG